MANQNTSGNNLTIDNTADIELSKPKKSRFLFLLFFFCYFIFAIAGCYRLSEYSFTKDDVEVNPSSLYNPEYK